MNIELEGTKERIFDIAIKHIAQNGFENTNLRDIANESGIKVASIYNHFKSKQEILDTIYDYFGEMRLENRKSIEHIKNIIETGTALDIITILSDTAFEFEEKIAIRMVLIPKIILMRIFQDEKANNFFINKWYVDDIEHLKKWLGYAKEIERLPKDFDVDNFSALFWKQLIMMAIWAFADPDYVVKILDEEKYLRKTFAEMLPLRKKINR